jgi:adenylate cyclase
MKAWVKGLVGALALLAAVQALGISEGLNRWLTDTHWRWKAGASREPFPSDLVVIGIDDRSVKDLGRLRYWSRANYARLLDRLREARAVGIDVLFTEADEVDQAGDAALAAALREHGRAVVPSYTWRETRPVSAETQVQLSAFLARLPAVGPRGSSLPTVNGLVIEPPLPAFVQAAAALGFADVGSDPDGVYRAPVLLKAVSGGDGDRLIPHFTTAVAAVATGTPLEEVVAGAPSALHLGDRTVALTDGLISLEPLARRGGGYARGPGAPVPLVSFADALESSPADWKGKIVLVGETATGTTDIRPNPLDPGLRGVELNAEILANLLYRPPVGALPLAAQWALIFAAIGIPLWLYSAFKPAQATLGAVVTLLALTGVMEAGFWLARLVPSWSPVLFGLAGSTLLMGLQRLAQEEQAKQQIRDSFSVYVSPELVEEIVNDPSRAQAEGTRQRIAVLFSDVRGFTTYSEQNPPELVVRQMREYLTEMTESVMAQEAVLDKFIGDAVMALFGPLHEEEQNVSAKAVACALDMLERLDRLNAAWAEEGLPLFRIGIGLHVGDAIVGNIGSPQRQQYTALGDTVNSAARLESACKDLMATLVLSQAVKDEAEPILGQYVEFVDRGDLLVKGKEIPIRVYEARRRTTVDGTSASSSPNGLASASERNADETREENPAAAG